MRARLLQGLLCAAALSTLLTVPPARTAEAQPFDVVPTPNPSPERNLFRNVDGVADDDVWAVGDAYLPAPVSRHILYHWDGTGWTPSDAPFVNGQDHILWGVSAVASDAVWAAGLYSDFGLASSYILRWDGEEWNLVFHQEGTPTLDVVAIADNDVWAVGTTSDPRPTPAFALHWDGSSWDRIDPPLVGDRNHQLDTIDASSSDNVWAAGFVRFDSGARFTYVVQWDGSSWIDRSPQIPALTTIDVLTFAPDDTWIAVDVDNAWHWDGTDWTQYPISPGAFAGLAPDDIYAFGAHDIHHWDGEDWTLVQTLGGLPAPAFRNGARGLPDGSVWAVGRTIDANDVFRTLAVHRAPGTADVAASEPVGAARLHLSPTFPNPAAGSSRFALRLDGPQEVTVSVHDVTGRTIATLHDGTIGAGTHPFTLEGEDLPAGIYHVRARGERFSESTRVTILR